MKESLEVFDDNLVTWGRQAKDLVSFLGSVSKLGLVWRTRRVSSVLQRSSGDLWWGEPMLEGELMQPSVSREMDRRPAGSRGQFSGIISSDPVGSISWWLDLKLSSNIHVELIKTSSQ